MKASTEDGLLLISVLQIQWYQLVMMARHCHSMLGLRFKTKFF